ncbi:MAG: endolytic transglycosylase MltG [Spirochaetae bacterium HGW-Spirochaetae-3]|jgi:UPF0755 protein|nr:MAG: endolytic transglycosylase MltG [Spirochaetae bacterium HGW-Spirochaetae-3]
MKSGALRVIGAFAAFILVVAVAGGVAVLAFAVSLDKPTGAIGPNGSVFTVGPGETGSSVARRLAQDEVIKSEYLFRLLMRSKGLEHSLKAGDYAIEADMGSTDILAMISGGKQALIRMTIPEGTGLKAIATAAEAAGIASADDVTAAAHDAALLKRLGIPAKSAIGYLFPDTYLLPRNAGGDEVVSLMVETMRKRVYQAVPEAVELSPEELHDRVILASIVEREYRVAEEAPLMASVFLNRLRIGMALQSCATVVYVISEVQDKPHPTRIFDRDLKIDDPFNTYLYPGLPPEPICDPGLTALSATLRPAITKYLYFRLVDEASGKHYFSATLDEHIRAASLAVKPKGR